MSEVFCLVALSELVANEFVGGLESIYFEREKLLVGSMIFRHVSLLPFAGCCVICSGSAHAYGSV